MTIAFNFNELRKDLTNIVEYSYGFLDGIHLGKEQFMHNLGIDTVEALKEFIDSNARTDPSLLSHMYEWYLSGTPEARLFDFRHTVTPAGITIASSFSQSRSIQSGSNEPFYNKAKVMELGQAVVVKPKNAQALSFVVDGNEVFTKSPVIIRNPGGALAKGGFEHTIKTFFESYFKQSFMRTTGIASYLENPIDYKLNMPAGKRSGKPAGITTGERWIAKAGKAV
ncbi:hypothetical protein UFOVP222_38 [uncultured Caudovirales phage]|uniref:Uncharacterized protein n=1 Tax=uncultured Caudovirales phage TaxID=2100421 RepID=A0A6J5TBV0_9CAUD|nr:hypothetical protein UFOVP108_33 [uncultured Caudovirales phage]CAB5219194.1 hypothetical protein UFOVP222_38 [uncultured Caudovirales phage]